MYAYLFHEVIYSYSEMGAFVVVEAHLAYLPLVFGVSGLSSMGIIKFFSSYVDMFNKFMSV